MIYRLNNDKIKIMEREVVITKSFEEAEEQDILQHISMTPEERQDAARELKIRIFGENNPDVREYHQKK